MEITIPVSLGELIDKYTILQIKIEKITDPEKVIHVANELNQLRPYLPEDKVLLFYMKMLKEINGIIWDLSNEIRIHPDPQKCVDIIHHNDRRFRVKNKINHFSALKEQKSYPKKTVVFFGHTEAGDSLTNIGIVRYLSTTYDQVVVSVKPEYILLNQKLYEDDPTIIAKSREDLAINNYYPLYGQNTENRKYYHSLKATGVDVVGVYGLRNGSEHSSQDKFQFYDLFYLEAGIDPKYRFLYNYIPQNVQDQLPIPDKDYIFIHEKSNGFSTSNITSDDHRIYANSEENRNILLINFAQMMENAKEIHVQNSSFFCLACYLDLSRVKRLVVYNRAHNYMLFDYPPRNQKWEFI